MFGLSTVFSEKKVTEQNAAVTVKISTINRNQKRLTHVKTTNHCMFGLLFSKGSLWHRHAAATLTVCLLALGAGAGEASQEETGAHGLFPHAGSGEIKRGNVTI